MKRQNFFTSVLLAFAFSTAAAGAEIAYIPSLPSPAMPVVPMPTKLPSRIDQIIPGRMPTRSLPGVPTIVPSLRLPAVSLPAAKAKKPVSLPGTAVATGKILLAPRAAGGSAEALKRLFDNAGSKQAPAVEDDADEIGPVKGDSSHLTLPESDLEIEIGIR